MLHPNKKLLLSIIPLFIVFLSFANNEKDTLAYEFIELSVTQHEYSTQIIWKVQGEQQGNTYVVHKAIEENKWIEKVRVSSTETDTTIQEYNQAISDRVEAPVEYYRLVRLVNGKEEVMGIETIYHKVLSDMSIESPPGQANREVMIEFKSLIDTQAKISVEDINGEVYYSNELDVILGENYHALKLKKFKAGRYLVIIRDQHDNRISKALVVY